MTDNNEVLKYITKSFDLKRQGFYKPAIEMLYKALAIDNNNEEILSQLAELYFLLENNQRAINYIEKTLEINPLNSDCLKLMKKIYYNEKNYIEAQRAAVKVFELAPTAENFADKIRILNKINDFETVKYLENEDFDFDADIYYEFAISHYQNEDYTKAIEFLEKAVELRPENIKIETLLAEMYYLNNNIEKSKNLFNKYKNEDDNAVVMNYLGLFSLEASKIESAIEYFSSALKLDSQNAKYAYNLSNAYFENGWSDEATKYMNIAICLDPENCEYRYAQAYYYFLMSKFDKVIGEINNIFKINPDYINAQILNALIKSKQGDPVFAKVELNKIVKENPNNIFALNSMSQVCVDLNQLDLAVKSMQKVVQLNPSLINKTEYANLLIDNNNYGEAQEIIESILNDNPNYLEAYILQSKNYIYMKDFENAFETAQKIIEIDQNCANGYFYNALALFEMGDTNFAIESMKKAISLDVNNAMYYVRMSEFYQKLGQNENALAYISEAASIDESAQNKELYAKLANIVRKTHNV